MTYTVDQCKGKMGHIKLIWRKLINLREKTGFGYDPTSGKLTTEQERWDRLALEDPEGFSCKDVKLANMDMLTEMWATRAATGANARPSTQVPRETSMGSSNREDGGSPSVSGPTSEVAGPYRPTSIRMSMTSRWSGRSSGRTDKLDEMVDSFKSANSEKSQRRTMTNAEIDQVYDALKALGVQITHFTAAINSLQTHEMRYFFLKMSNPEKLAWVMGLL